MRNFESVTSNIDAFIEFAKNNEWEIRCEDCIEDSLCCSQDCFGNLIKFLKREKEVPTDNTVDNKEFSTFYSKLKSASKHTVSEYTDVNYSVNVFNSWRKEGLSLTDNQKQELLSLKEMYEDKMNHLKDLKSIFDLIENE